MLCQHIGSSACLDQPKRAFQVTSSCTQRPFFKASPLPAFRSLVRAGRALVILCCSTPCLRRRCYRHGGRNTRCHGGPKIPKPCCRMARRHLRHHQSPSIHPAACTMCLHLSLLDLDTRHQWLSRLPLTPLRPRTRPYATRQTDQLMQHRLPLVPCPSADAVRRRLTLPPMTSVWNLLRMYPSANAVRFICLMIPPRLRHLPRPPPPRPSFRRVI